MIIAWGCYYYGKVFKWFILYPLWILRHKIYRVETLIYNHAIGVRRRWDTYMFNQEARDLR